MSASMKNRRDRGDLPLALRHIALPALAPLAIVALYSTPLTVIGCRDRGLLALAVLGVSTAAALACAAIAVKARTGDGDGAWWMLSTVILVVPAALLLGPLG